MEQAGFKIAWATFPGTTSSPPKADSPSTTSTAPIWLRHKYPGVDVVSQQGVRLHAAERYMDDISVARCYSCGDGSTQDDDIE